MTFAGKIARFVGFVRHEAIHTSIIRRSIMLLAFTVPGYVLNFALMIVATHFLRSEAFGIFYTAVSIINILFTPAAILVLFQSRLISKIRVQQGEEAAIAAFMSCFKTVVAIGAALALLGMAALSAAGAIFGIDSYLIVVLVTLAAYLAYPVESLRATLQGLQKFFWLGLVGLAWMGLRFGFALGGLALFEIPSAGVLGFSLASLVLLGFFLPRVVSLNGLKSAPLVRVDIRGVLPLIAGFLIFSGWIYADVLAGYVFLSKEALGIYSGSSILPKAMILLCMPIAQVLYPVLAEEHALEKNKGLKSLMKGLFMTLAVSGAFAATAILASSWICGGAYSIKNCAPDAMTPLMLSAIPICMLRVLIMYQLSRHHDAAPLFLIVPAGFYGAYLLTHGSSMAHITEFATTFCVFSWGAFFFYALQTAITAAFPRVFNGKLSSP